MCTDNTASNGTCSHLCNASAAFAVNTFPNQTRPLIANPLTRYKIINTINGHAVYRSVLIA